MIRLRRSVGYQRKILLVLLLLLLLVGVGGSSFADTFSFSGDRTEVVLTEGRERTLLQGNAVVQSDAIELRADEIELSGENFRYAESLGRVAVYDSERSVRISAATLRFDRETENSLASGAVIIEDEENELLLKGEHLETREGGDLIFVQSAVRVLKEDLTARAQFLRYRRNEEILELSGFPVVFWKGDEYRATRIVLNLETDEIEMQGQVQGEIVVEDENEDENEEEEATGDEDNGTGAEGIGDE